MRAIARKVTSATLRFRPSSAEQLYYFLNLRPHAADRFRTMTAGVLFVDDEPLICELYGMLGPILGPGYTISVVASPQEGLALLEKTPVDIVVSDLVMPKMHGQEFMTEVAKRHPGVMRIILSAYEDQLTIARCLMFAHRYLTKPFDLEKLAAVLHRICRLKHEIGGEKIQRIVAGLGALPTPPKIYQRLMKALNSEFTSLDEVGEIIQEDPGLTVKLLQIGNSAFFGGGRTTFTPAEAVQLVGIEILRGLVLCVHAFKFYEQKRMSSISPAKLWEHSMETAEAARRLARYEHLSRAECDEAFVSGLLHDIGKLVLAGNADLEYAAILKQSAQGAAADQLERETFGATHAQVGAYLLGLWGLPDRIVDTVDLHHDLNGATEKRFTSLTAVHVAQCLKPSGSRKLDLEHLKEIGAADRVAEWQEHLRN